jgi:hypothetical protein
VRQEFLVGLKMFWSNSILLEKSINELYDFLRPGQRSYLKMHPDRKPLIHLSVDESHQKKGTTWKFPELGSCFSVLPSFRHKINRARTRMALDEQSFNMALTDQTFLEWIEEHNLSSTEIKLLYQTWIKLSQTYQELEFGILSMDYVPL